MKTDGNKNFIYLWFIEQCSQQFRLNTVVLNSKVTDSNVKLESMCKEAAMI
jgi:hypothetical protein